MGWNAIQYDRPDDASVLTVPSFVLARCHPMMILPESCALRIFGFRRSVQPWMQEVWARKTWLSQVRDVRLLRASKLALGMVGEAKKPPLVYLSQCALLQMSRGCTTNDDRVPQKSMQRRNEEQGCPMIDNGLEKLLSSWFHRLSRPDEDCSWSTILRHCYQEDLFP